MMCSPKRQRPAAFTLIELLVVVAIVATLLAILLPSLRQARATSRLAVCGSNLNQIGIGVHTYAIENADFIPRGPKPAHAFDFSGNCIATNQIWIGDATGPFPPANPLQYQGAGSLLATTCRDPEVFFCPGDDTFNLTQELPKIRTAASAYGSYIYRQLDHLPDIAAAGQLDDLGANEVDGVSIAVEVLALDTNSLGSEQFWHTNHGARTANILYRDASVRRYVNRDDGLAIPADAYPNPADILAALDQLLTNADYSYRAGQPHEAPRLDSTP